MAYDGAMHLVRSSRPLALVALVLLVGVSLPTLTAPLPQSGGPVQGLRSPEHRGSRITRLGAIGDSLSDEYFEQSYDYARAWTELLVEARWTEMGPTAADAGIGNWGEPRRTGYEDNWARYGQTTDGAIASGQHTGIADGVVNRGLSHAVVYLGGNDFAPWAFGTYGNIYWDVWTDSDIDAWIASRILNYREILDIVVPTGVHLVLATIIDFSPMPYVSQGAYPDPVRRERVATAVRELGDEVRALAEEYELVYLDLFELTRAMFGTNLVPNSTLLVGNVPIDLLASDTWNGSNPTAAWVDDGVHPNTVVQGIWANAIAVALDIGYDVKLHTFSEEQILANAGIAYGGANTLHATIGDYAAYVIDYTP